ncbi:hypothetical protein WMW72_14510 [Paenibacillus filicis]|uniref:Uncharacterized protein n=1 Tax=Paenibacillus filicis TaxID=669464 RepID=A0ABU9DJR6_9BACL
MSEEKEKKTERLGSGKPLAAGVRARPEGCSEVQAGDTLYETLEPHDQGSDSIRDRLDAELSGTRFTGQHKVLERTHPKGWRQKLSSWWNSELELPLVPVSLVFLVLFGAVEVNRLQSSSSGGKTTAQERRELIEVGGSTYWKDEFDKAVARSEGQG